MKKLVIMIAAIAIVAIVAQAEEGKQRAESGGPGARKALMEGQLLPPKVVEDLSLTADQKTKLDEMSAAFKKEVEAWEQAHPNFKDEVKKAREAQDKEAMKKLMEERKPVYESRKKYIEQFKASLTDEQKKKLEDMKPKMGRRQGPKPGGPAPADK